MSDETTLLPCPFCGGNNIAASYHSPFVVCEDCGAFGPGSADSTHDEAIAAWNARATHGTLTTEQVRETVEKHWHDLPADYGMPEATALPEYSYDWQAIADELNAALGSGNADTDDALALLDEIREAGRISYDDYSQLFDVIAELGRGTCHMSFIDEHERPSGEEDYLCECSECGSQEWEPAHDLPLYCRKCGRKVER